MAKRGRTTIQPPTPAAAATGERWAHKADACTYQLEVSLMETDPPIWRRLRVPGDTTLARLDRIIQTAMGWTNSHLHTFTAGGVVYSVPDPEWKVRDERRVRLNGIVKEEGEAFIYEYDLGDSWRHQVLVEKVGFESGDAVGPLCLGGSARVPRKTVAAFMATTRHSGPFAIPATTSTSKRKGGSRV